jgi:putative NADH-flavin reductase
MKIALIGATGFVGQALLTELLSRGHQVTALVRDSARLAARDGLQVTVADAYDPAQVRAAVAGHDAVLSAFNAGWTNPDLYSDFLRGSRAIVAGVEAAGVRRFLVVGGAGSLHLPDGSQLVDAPDFPADYRDGARAARDALTDLQANTALDWSFLSPPIAFHAGVPNTRTGHYRRGTDTPLMAADGSPGSISAADLAVALVDELEHPQHLRQRFTVAW